jgi:amino acid permease
MMLSKTEKIAIVIGLIIAILPLGIVGYVGYNLLTSPIPAKLGKKFNNWLDEK